jgi:mono/diheme cytochrome c family protein
MRMSHSTKKSSLPLVALLLIIATHTDAADEVAQGRAIYLQYCASCHGMAADGKGPLAPILTTPPANLRLLAARYGNPLPEDQIARFIDGRADIKAHGPRDMPVWGTQFFPEAQGAESGVRFLIARLVAYLQSIQSGARSVPRN